MRYFILGLSFFISSVVKAQQSTHRAEGPLHEAILNAVANGQTSSYREGTPPLDYRSNPQFRQTKSFGKSSATSKKAFNVERVVHVSSEYTIIKDVHKSEIVEILRELNKECIGYEIKPSHKPKRVNIFTYPCKSRFTKLKEL